MNPTEPMLLIPQKQAQELVDYLKQRPFAEVFQLINGLLRLQPAQPAPTPTAPPKE